MRNVAERVMRLENRRGRRFKVAVFEEATQLYSSGDFIGELAPEAFNAWVLQQQQAGNEVFIVSVCENKPQRTRAER